LQAQPKQDFRLDFNLLAKQVLSQLSYTPTAWTNSFNSKTLPTILLSDSPSDFLGASGATLEQPT
jgi:hypothetical protein